MKQCSKCKEEKSDSSFAWKNKEKGTLQSWCKDCHTKYNKKLYQKHRKREMTRVLKRKGEIRQWFYKYLSSEKCNRCGESCMACLTFHHINPTEKEIDISVAVGRGWSIQRILKEMKKCEILCFNCHLKEHWKGKAYKEE